MPMRLVTKDTRNKPCSRRRKCSALTTKLTASSQIRNRTSFLNANQPVVGFVAQKIETSDSEQNNTSGNLTGRKKMGGRAFTTWIRYRTPAAAKNAWEAAIEICSVRTNSEKAMAAHLVSWGRGNSPHVRSRMLSKRVTGMMKLYWNRRRNSSHLEWSQCLSLDFVAAALSPGVFRDALQEAAGGRSVKVEPLPNWLSTLTVPFMRSMICLTMESPRPVPPTSRERALSTR